MNYLLDTQILLRAIYDDESLSPALRIILSDNEHQFYVSHASLWEVGLMQQQGQIDTDPEFFNILAASNLNELPISANHIAATSALPPMHSDMFDRMLLAQAASEGMVLVTDDVMMSLYDVPLLKN